MVSAPYEVQKKRVLERSNMTPEKFEDIISKQTPDVVKREKADFIVETNKGFDHAKAQVKTIIETINQQAL